MLTTCAKHLFQSCLIWFITMIPAPDAPLPLYAQAPPEGATTQPTASAPQPFTARTLSQLTSHPNQPPTYNQILTTNPQAVAAMYKGETNQ